MTCAVLLAGRSRGIAMKRRRRGPVWVVSGRRLAVKYGHGIGTLAVSVELPIAAELVARAKFSSVPKEVLNYPV